ncbi:hypothetical protein GSI_08649 [Ganoderma sinense ZZ0214-1]|uniref:Uncharacterized protein n=1 Tax=Ganoderma sinense ZZ0214-1 TaxID=1077348 RepID=A0A2G8S4F4_9APHY|nr:hypothetical protein GSI_08649 [Ganoderma sinense ZZ0214-1]
MNKADFFGQVQTFLNQTNKLDLYVVIFGVNRWRSEPQAAAQVILSQIRILASSPTSARKFLVMDMILLGLHDLSRGVNCTGAGEGVDGKPRGPALTVAFAEFARIWDGVFDGSPGFEPFGYVSTDACITDCSITFCGTDEICDDPDHCFYYIPGLVSPPV